MTRADLARSRGDPISSNPSTRAPVALRPEHSLRASNSNVRRSSSVRSSSGHSSNSSSRDRRNSSSAHLRSHVQREASHRVRKVIGSVISGAGDRIAAGAGPVAAAEAAHGSGHRWHR